MQISLISTLLNFAMFSMNSQLKIAFQRKTSEKQISNASLQKLIISARVAQIFTQLNSTLEITTDDEPSSRRTKTASPSCFFSSISNFYQKSSRTCRDWLRNLVANFTFQSLSRSLKRTRKRAFHHFPTQETWAKSLKCKRGD